MIIFFDIAYYFFLLFLKTKINGIIWSCRRTTLHVFLEEWQRTICGISKEYPNQKYDGSVCGIFKETVVEFNSEVPLLPSIRQMNETSNVFLNWIERDECILSNRFNDQEDVHVFNLVCGKGRR